MPRLHPSEAPQAREETLDPAAGSIVVWPGGTFRGFVRTSSPHLSIPTLQSIGYSLGSGLLRSSALPAGPGIQRLTGWRRSSLMSNGSLPDWARASGSFLELVSRRERRENPR